MPVHNCGTAKNELCQEIALICREAVLYVYIYIYMYIYIYIYIYIYCIYRPLIYFLCMSHVHCIVQLNLYTIIKNYYVN